MSHSCSTAVWGVSFVKGRASVAAIDSVSGIDCYIDARGSLTPGLIITTAQGTDKTQTCPRGSPSPRGPAGSVSLHAHIPGDIISFPHQHSVEGAVRTTSQSEVRSQAYLWVYPFWPSFLLFTILNTSSSPLEGNVHFDSTSLYANPQVCMVAVAVATATATVNSVAVPVLTVCPASSSQTRRDAF